jgi:23S rRNA pseudouridine1911/1915/1917 synthase
LTPEIISIPPADEALLSGDLPEGLDGADDPDTASEQRAFAVPIGEHGLRIDKVLALHAPEFSRGYFQQLLEAGAVRVNSAVVRKVSSKLKAGDAVLAELRPTAQASAFVAEAMALAVVHEDEHLLVIDKPAGLVVHPAAGHWQGTLLNGLLAHHAGAARLPRAGIVHRLDKDTSGLMLVGKSQQAVDALVRMIAAREVHRVYLALAQGTWRGEGEQWVDRPIGRDPRNRLRMAVHPPESTVAKPAQTRVRLLDAVPPCLLVGCKLHTGRTHQIRVHMAWLGLPLVADAVYGGKPALGLTRQALHAHRLALRHPVTGQALVFHSPLPADMAQALQTAGLHYNPDTLWPVDAP